MADNLDQMLQEVQMLCYQIEGMGIETEDNEIEEWRSLSAKISHAVNYIVWKYANKSCQIMSSDAFLHMLLSDSKFISTCAMTLLRKIVNCEFSTIKHEYQQAILQELTYKLSHKSASLAREASQTLLSIVSSCPSTVEILHKHYPMLADLLMKWSNCGFDDCLLRLKSALDYHFDLPYSDKKRIRAAIRIQSAWRGYAERKRLANLKSFVIQFQHKARLKMGRTTFEKQRHFEKQHRHFEDHLNKIKSLKRIHEYEQDLMQSAASANWLRIHREDLIKAAICIQKTWRGCKCRLHLKKNKQKLVQHRAARIIQRKVRQWLLQRRISRRKCAIIDQETSKEKCQEIIEKWLKDRQDVKYSKEHQRQLHAKAQCILEKFREENSERRNTVIKLNTLQAHIETDIDLIGNNPCLESNNVKLYCNLSGNLEAKKRHRRQLAVMRSPWLGHLIDPEQEEIE